MAAESCLLLPTLRNSKDVQRNLPKLQLCTSYRDLPRYHNITEEVMTKNELDAYCVVQPRKKRSACLVQLHLVKLVWC